MILLIDNYDSFTWNLVHRIGELDPSLDINVVRNDQITVDEALALDPSHVIISPGPCTPTEAGGSTDIINAFKHRVPVLGVCLGHQCIGASLGLTVARHPRLMHGKTSDIHHDGKGIYTGLDPAIPITVTRYHSLVVLPSNDTDHPLPEGWTISAWFDEEVAPGDTRRVIMGLRRESQDPAAPLFEGVQYHPESFLTTVGPLLLANFLGLPAPAIDSVAPGTIPS